MTRQELTDAVGQLLGIHATEVRVATIVLLADAYAATFAADQVEKTLASRGLAR